MSRLKPNQLTARKVETWKKGDLCDGGGLWLNASPTSRGWTFRFTSPVTGKRREMGLGSAFDVPLAMARQRASEARILLAESIDPLDRKREAEQARKLERASSITFEQVARGFIEEQAPGWKDKKAEPIWRRSLEQHIFPVFGGKPVNRVETDDVLAALRPIWETKTETASRLRSRIERILGYAKAHGWREGENAARWRGHLDAILPPAAKVAKVTHHAAVDRKDIGKVMASLATSDGLAAKAVRFTCLTAARSGEVRAATWDEIDLQAKVWTIPPSRMKAGREHRVPLTDGALAILEAVKPLRDAEHGDLVFPGQKAGKALSDVALSKALHSAASTKEVTIHGLRSTFRDWAAEETHYPREVAEMALAHAIGDKVEAAYRRGDLFEKRREMMEEWASMISQSHALRSASVLDL
ncbi:integrase arm-type DNA-binding domain-containing protein [Kozakia baliensis]|uniref:tyrosine-type recombinase/integrase n=1 Tax=Kozakia baliensis TaxID=153496 RepID=UPI00345BC7FD